MNPENDPEMNPENDLELFSRKSQLHLTGRVNDWKLKMTGVNEKVNDWVNDQVNDQRLSHTNK